MTNICRGLFSLGGSLWSQIANEYPNDTSMCHTFLTTCSLYALKFPKNSSSRIFCANKSWRIKKRKQCDAVLLATMWWPQQGATERSSSPCLVSSYPHTCTHRKRERARSCPPHLCALLPLLLLLQNYASNLGHVQGRHNSSHHSSTQAKFKTRTPMPSCKLKKTHFGKYKNAKISHHLFKKISSAVRKHKPIFSEKDY